MAWCVYNCLNGSVLAPRAQLFTSAIRLKVGCGWPGCKAMKPSHLLGQESLLLCSHGDRPMWNEGYINLAPPTVRLGKGVYFFSLLMFINAICAALSRVCCIVCVYKWDWFSLHIHLAIGSRHNAVNIALTGWVSPSWLAVHPRSQFCGCWT